MGKKPKQFEKESPEPSDEDKKKKKKVPDDDEESSEEESSEGESPEEESQEEKSPEKKKKGEDSARTAFEDDRDLHFKGEKPCTDEEKSSGTCPSERKKKKREEIDEKKGKDALPKTGYIHEFDLGVKFEMKRGANKELAAEIVETNLQYVDSHYYTRLAEMMSQPISKGDALIERFASDTVLKETRRILWGTTFKSNTNEDEE